MIISNQRVKNAEIKRYEKKIKKFNHKNNAQP